MGVNIQLVTVLKQHRGHDAVCIALVLLITRADNLGHLCLCHVHYVSVLHVYDWLLLKDVSSNPQELCLMLFCTHNTWHSTYTNIDT